ncbi:putative Mitochondrial DnaJ chaperone [Taphrina deformans PYCC 5710]|uniref:DnaJ homolog 1, mitochondrial n=1 Tax=Taphrina deformans (strain PYCC 5710 / ATCC 11124 / CBS 356.35 / IMI 108563 / JCM 9778 / NBRC 8474) TaxID=1097556 RepID=R4XG73_TAPDE|nr:putative Mitochondrial DnaJ chaperone [Taphrina deformans PYCC 5710]|eukprot:CCG83494.1 putative Mitochondrial DnaJ chaperone [Taphrina deformans PYCC 5710]
MLHRSLLNHSLSNVSRCFSTSRVAQAVTDPYKILGVDKSADKSKIKKAYFNLAKQYHPDSNKDPKAKDRYVEVQEAYEILKDPTKKEQFDAYGAQGFDANGNPQQPGGFGGFGGNPFGGGGGSPFGAGGFDFNDIFSAFGGGQRGGQQQARSSIVVGDAIEVAATISFMDAAKGASKSINLEPLTKCKPCTGSGMKPGEKKSACLACGGAGTRIHVMQGGFQMQMTCEVCGGAGIVIPRGKECGSCGGEGVTRERKTVQVDIPAGIEDGMRLRVAGEGDAPNVSGQPTPSQTRPGDLYVHIRIQPSADFTRDGPHLRHRATIPMTTAALGGRCRIPTLDGSVDIKVSPGTNSGDTITMSGRGMPRVSSDARARGLGDLHVEFRVLMPKRVSPYERNLLEQLALSFGDSTTRKETQVPPSKPFTSETPAGPGPDKGASSVDSSGTGGIFSSIFDKYRNKDQKDDNGDDQEEKKATG